MRDGFMTKWFYDRGTGFARHKRLCRWEIRQDCRALAVMVLGTVLISGVGAFLVYLFLRGQSSYWAEIPTPAILLFGIGPFPSFFVMAWMMVRSRHRQRRAVVASRGCTCPNCLYDLRGMNPEGRCPECRLSYRHDTLLSEWMRRYRFMNRVQDEIAAGRIDSGAFDPGAGETNRSAASGRAAPRM